MVFNYVRKLHQPSIIHWQASDFAVLLIVFGVEQDALADAGGVFCFLVTPLK